MSRILKANVSIRFEDNIAVVRATKQFTVETVDTSTNLENAQHMAKNAVSITKQTIFHSMLQYRSHHQIQPVITWHSSIASQKGQEIEQGDTGLSSSFVVY